jgi:enamine deaminase RidA (YjgF/YER057c/UK114 family)
MKREMLQPNGLGRPIGMYSHVCLTDARSYAFVAGQLAVDTEGRTIGIGNFATQVRQVLENLRKAIEGAGGSLQNVVKMTTYLVHSQDIEDFYKVREETFGDYFPDGDYPPNTLLVVDRLVREECLIEIEATAGIS